MADGDPRNVFETLISVLTHAKTTNDWHSLSLVADALRREKPVFINENYGRVINVIQSSDTVIADSSNVATAGSTIKSN